MCDEESMVPLHIRSLNHMSRKLQDWSSKFGLFIEWARTMKFAIRVLQLGSACSRGRWKQNRHRRFVLRSYPPLNTCPCPTLSGERTDDLIALRTIIRIDGKIAIAGVDVEISDPSNYEKNEYARSLPYNIIRSTETYKFFQQHPEQCGARLCYLKFFIKE